ncbi:hypothetical protein GE21DRAFT_5592 [Neurospora crassa]|uniref:Uncharacterized protein n=1 Tax=Neurospora crassa (strain ATCC 24698 / 74-OR23-1A / CBS 708.71 / DSM 1257 / FGSC 987) TaxID=367110 RepID=Q7S843_NEUCR|nr:hypothetical protein NCU06574 [Neurospora crassa OR74A]EAA32508.2 hypothetical protein NCU06574 [Neurospora crassa OR74A]KHE78289.1 hypothetical protein GE21DRAFT_5592 [Neurospora crassa]|eukprot:XP_961744.2 hypothetical protein NCU06574 [Neurospora crassa OR74A]
MKTTADSLYRQLQLTTPRITSLIQNVHHEISCLDSFSEIRQRFTHTVFVRLSDLDRYLVQAVLLTPSPYIDLSKDNEQETDEVSRLLFLRWSWADAVLRNVLARLLGFVDHNNPGCVSADTGQVDALAEELSVRHDGKFPGDRRARRVERLIHDELNEDFFEGMRKDPWKLSRELTDITIAPHPDDIPMWRLVARQVTDRYRPCLRWPGVHFAAAKAGFYEDGRRDLFEYPFYGEWWSEAFSAIPSATTPEEPSTESSTNDRTELERGLRAVFDAADVWDVWTLCRVWLCEEALWGVDQEPGTARDFAYLESLEMFNKHWIRKTQQVAAPARNMWDPDNEFLQRRHIEGSLEESDPGYREHEQLLTTYLALNCSAPIPEPKEWFFFASYGNFHFWDITDQNIVSGLLESANLDPQSQTWDLVCMSESRKDQEHIVSMDMNPLDFAIRAAAKQLSKKMCVRTWTRHGLIGYAVFLVLAVFAYALCYVAHDFTQQNDCFLIRGLDHDDDLKLIDRDTIYVLETLQGIRARLLKAVEQEGEHDGLETTDRPHPNQPTRVSEKRSQVKGFRRCHDPS